MTCRTPVSAVLLLVIISSPPAAQERPVPQAPRAARALTDLSGDLQALAQTVAPAVVQIFVTSYVPGQGDPDSSAGLLSTERTTGSGVILDPDGYIVTNAHVVENATRVEVELPAEETTQQPRSILRRRGRLTGAQVVAIDYETDLAVLKVAAKGLPALSFGDSDDLRPGQIVLAFGSPLGLEASVSMGVVSAVARQLEPDDPMIYIQTDAPINPGSSGGPLVDTAGRVIGINTMIYSQSGGHEGIGFAAPSNIVRNVFQQIRKTGRVRRGEIGIAPQTITPQLAAALGLPQDWGVILGDVFPGGPAARAGLEVGDVVLSLDGKTMENGRQLRVNLYGRGIGDEVRLEILRDGRKLTARVPVVQQPDDPARLAEFVTRQQHLVPRLGILAINLDSRIAELLPPLRRESGVVVAAASLEAPMSPQGRFEPGDVIYELNRKPIRSLDDLRAAIDGIKPGEPVAVQLERFERLMYVAFRIE
jgi:serine protease Do